MYVIVHGPALFSYPHGLKQGKCGCNILSVKRRAQPSTHSYSKNKIT